MVTAAPRIMIPTDTPSPVTSIRVQPGPTWLRPSRTRFRPSMAFFSDFEVCSEHVSWCSSLGGQDLWSTVPDARTYGTWISAAGLAQTPAPYMLVDESGELVHFSTGLERLSGYSEAEVRGVCNFFSSEIPGTDADANALVRALGRLAIVDKVGSSAEGAGDFRGPGGSHRSRSSSGGYGGSAAASRQCGAGSDSSPAWAQAAADADALDTGSDERSGKRRRLAAAGGSRSSSASSSEPSPSSTPDDGIFSFIDERLVSDRTRRALAELRSLAQQAHRSSMPSMGGLALFGPIARFSGSVRLSLRPYCRSLGQNAFCRVSVSPMRRMNSITGRPEILYHVAYMPHKLARFFPAPPGADPAAMEVLEPVGMLGASGVGRPAQLSPLGCSHRTQAPPAAAASAHGGSDCGPSHPPLPSDFFGPLCHPPVQELAAKAPLLKPLPLDALMRPRFAPLLAAELLGEPLRGLREEVACMSQAAVRLSREGTALASNLTARVAVAQQLASDPQECLNYCLRKILWCMLIPSDAAQPSTTPTPTSESHLMQGASLEEQMFESLDQYQAGPAGQAAPSGSGTAATAMPPRAQLQGAPFQRGARSGMTGANRMAGASAPFILTDEGGMGLDCDPFLRLAMGGAHAEMQRHGHAAPAPSRGSAPATEQTGHPSQALPTAAALSTSAQPALPPSAPAAFMATEMGVMDSDLSTLLPPSSAALLFDGGLDADAWGSHLTTGTDLDDLADLLDTSGVDMGLLGR